MAIQWFPGHMHAARKQVAETMAKVDVVIEIVDARLPWSSTNPMIENLRKHRQRPALKILNKQDLADPKLSRVWYDWFKSQSGVEALLLGEDNKKAAATRISQLCSQLAPHRTGVEKPLRAMILGIPNVGKSTLMNHLAKRRIANVADTPGVTKSQQRIELPGGTILYDTPGLMWPKVEIEECGYRLALAGSIGTNAYDQVDVAWFAIETLCERYPQALLDRYGALDLDKPVEELFAAIARRRGAMLSGGRVDEQKTAELILTDFRSGTLGRITLETPDDIREPLPEEIEMEGDEEMAAE
ncbi:ribosome biogenesis GTPase A [Formivibrio citricus]|uniref:Ribosome biogenesis GTPase A n=1 Tax=Formivibrio citricus TaxID=83765 RepID=A0A1I4ZGH1_9NEIS|nr:ribosome biogenesis GTPase YlqF [Formivibrio citricus]SFN49143.1 ribosome biogenesis GTPase A [Formivibrio citricus]